MAAIALAHFNTSAAQCRIEFTKPDKEIIMPTAKKAEAETRKAPFTEKAKAAAHETIDKAAERASAAEEHLREAVENSGESLADKKAAIELEFDTAANQARKFIVENPLMAAGIAFTAGWLVTSLFGKRN